MTHPFQQPTFHYITTHDGVRLRIARWGSKGPPVVLLHGFAQHWYAWRHVASDLAADHRVYAIDLRGSGGSDAPRCGYDTATRTADVLAVLGELGLPAVALVGHESGGWLGFHVALAAPERVTSLVALNTPHPWIPHRLMLPQLWRYWYTALLEYPVLGAWVMRRRPGVLRWLLRRGRPGVDERDVEVFVEATRRPAYARAAQQVQWQLVLHDIPRRLLGGYRRASLAVPALLLAGSRDFALSPGCAASVPASGTLRVRTVDGGHYLPEESPQLVADVVRQSAQAAGGGGS